jgi:integrase
MEKQHRHQIEQPQAMLTAEGELFPKAFQAYRCEVSGTLVRLRHGAEQRLEIPGHLEHRLHQLEMRLEAGSKWHEQDLVFCNVYGNFLHPFRLYQMFHKVLAAAGLPHMRFHDLRHSAATILLKMGVTIKVVQEILGHSDITMTLGIYSHVLPGMQEEAVEKISSLFEQST